MEIQLYLVFRGRMLCSLNLLPFSFSHFYECGIFLVLRSGMWRGMPGQPYQDAHRHLGGVQEAGGGLQLVFILALQYSVYHHAPVSLTTQSLVLYT